MERGGKMNKIIIKDLEFSTNADLCLEAKGFIQVFIIKVNFGQDTKKPVFTVYVDEKHYLSYDTLESAINH